MASNKLVKNSANIITLIRVCMIFAVLFLLFADSKFTRIIGVIILLFALLLDSVDGYISRKLGVASNVGSLIDTLGDRITENVLLVFLAYYKLISLFIPVIFIVRSFISDFVRYLYFKKDISTFSINSSKIGSFVVASKASRIFYLVLKSSVFLLGALIMAFRVESLSLAKFLRYIAIVATVINLFRFAVLIYDCQDVLKETFLDDYL